MLTPPITSGLDSSPITSLSGNLELGFPPGTETNLSSPYQIQTRSNLSSFQQQPQANITKSKACVNHAEKGVHSRLAVLFFEFRRGCR
jgi:hypothetical protein